MDEEEVCVWLMGDVKVEKYATALVLHWNRSEEHAEVEKSWTVWHSVFFRIEEDCGLLEGNIPLGSGDLAV